MKIKEDEFFKGYDNFDDDIMDFIEGKLSSKW